MKENISYMIQTTLGFPLTAFLTLVWYDITVLVKHYIVINISK
jgi:hypothetical protein